MLGPLNPAEVATALSLPPADAVDAHLISGGLPGVIRSWSVGAPAMDFLRSECEDPTASVFSIPEASLQAEFPSPDLSRQVLEAVGPGNRTLANIAASTGGSKRPLASGTLSPLLRRLMDEKRLLAAQVPLSTRSARSARPALYRVADSNPRFYLAVREAHELSRRGRPDTAFALIERRWSTWRGRAVEPLVRESLEMAASARALPWMDVGAVGGGWDRAFNVEVDLVGADRAVNATVISFVGSVEWRVTPVDRRDVEELRRGAAQVPGVDPAMCGLVLASLSGRGGSTPKVLTSGGVQATSSGHGRNLRTGTARSGRGRLSSDWSQLVRDLIQHGGRCL